jgi:hypothetical protein
VAIGYDVLNMLIDLGWLGEAEALDRDQVGRYVHGSSFKQCPFNSPMSWRMRAC